MEKEDMIKDTKNGILFNGLYFSAKNLVKSFRNSPKMTDDEFILRMRILLDEWEAFRDEMREKE